MSFFSNKATSNSQLVHQRQKQLQCFKQRNPTARLVQKDNYRIQINTQFGPLPLAVAFPPQFPQVPPTISLVLQSPVIHQWVDERLTISRHPTIQRWSVNTDVGILVKQICDEFARAPPRPAPIQSNILRPVQQPHPVIMRQPSPSHQPVPRPNPQRQVQPPQRQVQPLKQSKPANPGFHVPNIPLPSLDHLKEKSIAELQIFMYDSNLRKEFIEELGPCKNMEEMKAELYTGVEKVALENLTRESEIKEKQTELKELRDKVELAKKEYAPYSKKKHAILSKFTYKSILKALDETIEETEEKSDKIRERYEKIDDSDSDSGSDNDQEEITHSKFCKIYTKERKKAHILLAKKERLISIYGQPT